MCRNIVCSLRNVRVHTESAVQRCVHASPHRHVMHILRGRESRMVISLKGR